MFGHVALGGGDGLPPQVLLFPHYDNRNECEGGEMPVTAESRG